MKRRGSAATLGPLFFLLCLLGQDLPELAARLAADELEVRADAEASLNAADPARLSELRNLRDAAGDVETRARLGAIVLRVLRRESRRLYEAGNLPEALRVLAEADGPDVQARAEASLKELLKDRSMEFSTGAMALPELPQLEPLLPWIYPALIRRLADGSPDRGSACVALLKLGHRAAPALVWALKTSTPSVQVQVCSLLDRMGTSSPLVLDALRAAAASPDAELRRYAGTARQLR